MALPNVTVNVGEETLLASNTLIPFVPVILMKTKSGPIGTIETITSESQFKALFGESDYTTPSAYAIQTYLRSYSYIMVTRLANELEAAIGSGKLSFVSNDESVDLIKVETNYKTDLFNGKEIKLVYDSAAHKIWLDVSAVTGKTTISIKEDFAADTAKATTLEAALDKLVTSINASRLGITLTNLFTDKTESDPVPSVAQFTEGLSFFIESGNCGNTTLDSGVVKGYIDMYDLPNKDIDVMIIPEYYNHDVINYAVELAVKNNFTVLTSPAVDTVTEAIQSVMNYNNDNRGSLAVYFPDVYYNGFYDNNRNLQRVPACVAVLHTYAKTDNTNKWGAPAGVTRGNLTLVNSLAVKLTNYDLETLYDNSIPVNGINDISGKGFIVWGNKTTTTQSAFFDRVNVARLVKYVTKQAYAISWNYLFEPITPYVFSDWTLKMETFLDTIKLGYGLEAYEVIMDDSINTAETVAANQLNGIIRLKPQEVAEFITIDLTITDVIEATVQKG